MASWLTIIWYTNWRTSIPINILKEATAFRVLVDSMTRSPTFLENSLLRESSIYTDRQIDRDREMDFSGSLFLRYLTAEQKPKDQCHKRWNFLNWVKRPILYTVFSVEQSSLWSDSVWHKHLGNVLLLLSQWNAKRGSFEDESGSCL